MIRKTSEISLLRNILRKHDLPEPSLVTHSLLILAAQHGVLALVADILVNDQDTILDQQGNARCDQAIKHFAGTELLNDAATKSFLETLRQADVPNLLLKGTALAHTCYQKPWHRPRTDIDVWIPRQRAKTVADVLRHEGYDIANENRSTLSSRQYQARITPMQGVTVTFDVHLELSNRAVYRHALDFDECLQGAQQLDSLNALAPATPELLIHACLHRVAQGRNTASDRLIWLYDIHLLHDALSPQDKDRLISLCVARRLGGTCADGLRRSMEAFAAELDEPLLQALEEHAADEPATRLLKAGKWPWVLSDIRGEPTLVGRARFIGELLKNRIKPQRQ